MPLATKNNAIIIKDGKLAENCDCCGGWYCDVSGGGACCEDGPAGSPATCSIKPSCECEGAGKSFKGVGTTCASNPCVCSCTARVSVPVSITVECRVVRPRADSVCPDPRDAFVAFFVGVDETFTEILYLKQQFPTCQGAVYESINPRRAQVTNPPFGPSTNGLAENGVYLDLRSEGGRCYLRGYFIYFAYSRNRAGQILAGEGLGTPGGAVGGAIGGGDQFWDNPVGQEINTPIGTDDFLLRCYPAYGGECTMKIVSVSYLP
jgi:hypothetical protein